MECYSTPEYILMFVRLLCSLHSHHLKRERGDVRFQSCVGLGGDAALAALLAVITRSQSRHGEHEALMPVDSGFARSVPPRICDFFLGGGEGGREGCRRRDRADTAGCLRV